MGSAKKNGRNNHPEEELNHTNKQLQIAAEDYETSNKELRPSNEELQAMNEELKTVNRELESKIDRLRHANDDLKNLIEAVEIAVLFVDREFRIKLFTSDTADIFNIVSTDLGRPLSHITHQLDYDGLLDDVKQVFDKFEKIKKVVRGKGGRWFLMCMRLCLTTENHIEGVVISFVDITRLKESELQLQNKVRQEETVARFGSYALSGRRLDEVIHRGLEVICEILQPDYCFLMERREDEDTMELRDAVGCADDAPEIKIDSDAKWDVPFAFDKKKSLVVTDYRREEQIKPLPMDKYKDIISGAHVVVEGLKKAFGTLSVYTVQKREFTDHDISYLQVVANLIGEALDRERQEEELKAANKELQDEIGHSIRLQQEMLNISIAERWKLGEYLHDNLGQKLVVKKMLLEDISSKLKDKEPDVLADIAQIQEIIEEDITNVRDLTHDIIPVDIEEGGIEQAFQLLLKHMEKIHEIKCTQNGDGVIEKIKNKKVATNLYLVIQEAIKNAAIHGEAENIKIDIREINKTLHLKIEDDGKGLAEGNIEQGGQGLRIMNHRLELMGGTCAVENIEDEAQSGTRVMCVVPLANLTG